MLPLLPEISQSYEASRVVGDIFRGCGCLILFAGAIKPINVETGIAQGYMESGDQGSASLSLVEFSEAALKLAVFGIELSQAEMQRR